MGLLLRELRELSQRGEVERGEERSRLFLKVNKTETRKLQNDERATSLTSSRPFFHSLPFVLPSMSSLRDLVVTLSGEYDPELVRWLDLSDQRLTTLADLPPLCPNLEELNMARNAVADLAPLAQLAKLRTLDASHNHIAQLYGIGGAPSLESLQLQGNEIADVDELKELARLPALRRLQLQECQKNKAKEEKAGANEKENQACNHPSYKAIVTGLLPGLTSLDGQRFDLGDCYQKAVLEAVDVPDEALDVPASQPWLQGVDADLGTGLELFEDDFVTKAVGQKLAKFEATKSACAQLTERADKAIASFGQQ